MRQWGRWVLGSVVVVVIAGACGGGSGSSAASTKAGWTAQHGEAVTAVSAELDRARTTLDAGNQQSIIGDCSLLRDDVSDANKGLPVPNGNADAALRRALTVIDQGAADCVQGARVASNATLNEKAMAELTDARAKMDAANQALAAWH